MIRFIFSSVVSLVLLGCGGSSGFSPKITAVKVESAQYSRTATIYVGGRDLRSSIQVDSAGGCTNPSYGASSTTELLVLNCTITTVGDVPFTFRAANGDLLIQSTVTVPKPVVALFTDQGNISMELDPAVAPMTVNNFLNYVNQGYYKDTLFHRVIAGFVVQGGGYTTGLVKKTGQAEPIVLESNKGLSNVRGTVAMARTNEPNSATSEFFINLVDNLSLDYKNEASPGYAVFGVVRNGLDVVDSIASQPTSTYNNVADVPVTDIVINAAVQIK